MIISLNSIIKASVGMDGLLSTLRTNHNESKVIEVLILAMLCDTAEYSKLKSVLLHRIEESSNFQVSLHKWLASLHNFSMSSVFRNTLDLDWISGMVESIRTVYSMRTKDNYVLLPETSQFERMHVVCFNKHIYSWNIFRVDDLHLGTESFCIADQFVGVREDFKSPNYIPSFPTPMHRPTRLGQHINLDEFKISDSLIMRPKVRSMKQIKGKRVPRRSEEIEPTQEQLGPPMRNSLTPRSKVWSVDSDPNVFSTVLASMDGLSCVDIIFNIQGEIEDSLKYLPIQSELEEVKSQGAPIPVAIKSCLDDKNAFFLGLGENHNPTKQGKQDAAKKIKKLLRPNDVIFLLKCYDSVLESDPEWSNLVKALGVQFDAIWSSPLGYAPWIGRSSDKETKLNPESEILVRGVENNYYHLINNDTNILESRLAQMAQYIISVSQKTKFTPSSYLILFGFDEELRHFRASHSELLRKFERVMLLCPTFDVNVLQLQIIQVADLFNLRF